MGNSQRGFASMSPEKQREIASKGGKAAHQKGTAHQFTSEEARAAGKKGGQASGQARAKKGSQSTPSASETGTSNPATAKSRAELETEEE